MTRIILTVILPAGLLASVAGIAVATPGSAISSVNLPAAREDPRRTQRRAEDRLRKAAVVLKGSTGTLRPAHESRTAGRS
jgi:hypothetical protein